MKRPRSFSDSKIAVSNFGIFLPASLLLDPGLDGFFFDDESEAVYAFTFLVSDLGEFLEFDWLLFTAVRVRCTRKGT